MTVVCSEYMDPFIKNGKRPAQVGSYRPIVLTSTIEKILESPMQTACYGGLRSIQIPVTGWQVSVREFEPPTSACGCHNSSLMDFTQPSAEAPLLLSSTLVRRIIVFGVRDS